jgi:hypothetical protein
VASWLKGTGLHRVIAAALQAALPGTDDEAMLGFIRRLPDRASLEKHICSAVVLNSIVELVWDEVLKLKQASAATAEEIQGDNHIRLEPRQKSAVPLTMLLEEATAAKAALGPMLISEKSLQGAMQASKATIDELEGIKSSDVRDVTMKKYKAAELSSELEAQHLAINAAMGRLEQVRLKAAERVGMPASRNFLGYEKAIEEVDPTGTAEKAFTARAEALFNCSPLHEGTIVQSRDGRKGKVLKAAASLVTKQDVYTVAFWDVKIVQDTPYWEGYDEQSAVMLPRSELYVYKVKQHQKISSETDGMASADIEYLSCMYIDAEKSNDLLHRLGVAVTKAANDKLQRKGVEALNTGLKSSTRVMEKVTRVGLTL